MRERERERERERCNPSPHPQAPFQAASGIPHKHLQRHGNNSASPPSLPPFLAFQLLFFYYYSRPPVKPKLYTNTRAELETEMCLSSQGFASVSGDQGSVRPARQSEEVSGCKRFNFSSPHPPLVSCFTTTTSTPPPTPTPYTSRIHVMLLWRNMQITIKSH